MKYKKSMVQYSYLTQKKKWPCWKSACAMLGLESEAISLGVRLLCPWRLWLDRVGRFRADNVHLAMNGGVLLRVWSEEREKGKKKKRRQNNEASNSRASWVIMKGRLGWRHLHGCTFFFLKSAALRRLCCTTCYGPLLRQMPSPKKITMWL